MNPFVTGRMCYALGKPKLVGWLCTLSIVLMTTLLVTLMVMMLTILGGMSDREQRL